MTHDEYYDTEYWHTRESRVLPDDTGQDHLIVLERRYWAAFDFLAVESHRNAEQIVGYAYRDAPKQGMSFEDSLMGYLAWMDTEYRNNPAIWKKHPQPSDKIIGYVGEVTRAQIEALRRQKTDLSQFDR